MLARERCAPSDVGERRSGRWSLKRWPADQKA
jgi:hypothetical protein